MPNRATLVVDIYKGECWGISTDIDVNDIEIIIFNQDHSAFTIVPIHTNKTFVSECKGIVDALKAGGLLHQLRDKVDGLKLPICANCKQVILRKPADAK